MRRRLLLVVVFALLVPFSAVPSGAVLPCGPIAEAVHEPSDDHARFVSVLPPGQSGDARLELPGAGVDFGDHFDDQLDMYGDLVYQTSFSTPDGVTEAEILDFFKKGHLDIDACESATVVGPGVAILRTNFGVPHVYGRTAEAVAYGAGYVTAQDRMFQADLFRRAAKGTLSTLLGPDFLEMDKATRRDGYTEAELNQQIANLPDKFGDFGVQIARGLEAFSAGFNQRIADVLADPRCTADSAGVVCPGLPVEYPGTGNLPEPWRPTDTVAEAVLLARQFGEAAGAEVRNAALFAGLVDTFGSHAEARRAFDDLRWMNDPAANTTVPAEDGAFTYPNTGPVDPAAVVIPDNAAAVYRGSYDVLAQLSELFTGVTGQSWPASNAILVAPSESATGNSLQLGNPQVNYAVPQYLMEIGLHGGGFDSVGMTFPGVSGFVLIGRGPDYAWTVTSGISDAVDVRVEKLCDPTGAPPQADSAFYLADGECVPMEQRTETILVKNSAPPALDPDAPEADVVVMRVQRTRHGPVFARDTVGGVPVALVKERAFWGAELDNAAAFGRFNFPAQITSAEAFGDAASAIVVSLNLYYADQDSVAYWHTGKYPIRAQGVDPRLPTWGTGEWEWSGYIPFSQQPHFISDADSPAARDYTYNWNNKPATGWANGDDTNWGEIHRVDALVTQLDERLAGDAKMSFVDVINVMNNAATVDSRAAKLGPIVLSKLNNSGGGGGFLGQVIATLNDWFEAGPVGAQRIDLAGGPRGDGFYDAGPAIRLWDALNEALVEEIFFDEIGHLRGLLGIGIVDEPGAGGSAFFDGMFNHVLHVLDPSPSLPAQHDWLEGENASHVVGRALDRALAALGVDSAAKLAALTMPREEIVFASQGASAPFRIHWVNRGTWTHFAEITGRRGS